MSGYNITSGETYTARFARIFLFYSILHFWEGGCFEQVLFNKRKKRQTLIIIKIRGAWLA